MKLRFLILAGVILAAAVPARPQTAGEPTKRFQLEVFGYRTTLREDPLNNAVGFQSDRQEYFYSTYLAYLYNAAILSSWKETVDGSWTGLASTYPLGVRLKYHISDHIIVSLGAEHLRSKATTSLSGLYERNYADGSTDQLSFEFKPFELTVTAWAPMIGLHIYEPAKENWSAEGGVLIGPVFGRILAESSWIERGAALAFNEGTPRLDPSRTSQGTYRMEGSGVGFCVEAEGHLSYFLTRSFGIFASINIGFRTVPKLSGPGREVRDGITTEWDGEWGMKQTTYQRAWDRLTAEYPSNDWTTDPTAVRTGNFHLDLSGIWMGVGLFVRF